MKFGNFKGLGWRPTGFTVEFTLRILPQETPVSGCNKNPSTVDPPSSSGEGQLIET